MVSFQPLSSIFRSTRQKWSTEIGAFHYRNKFIRSGNRLLVSSCGRVWNADDPSDGVYCLDVNSGEVIWKFHTKGDANGLALNGNVIVGGTDGGQVFAIDFNTGSLISEYFDRSPFYAAPLVVQRDGEDVFVSLSYEGTIVVFEPGRAAFRVAGRVNGDLQASPATSVALSARSTFILASESGEIMRVVLSDGEASIHLLYQLEDMPAATGGNDLLTVKGVGSLLISDSHLYVSYVRDTYDKHPPLCCLNVDTGDKIWDAKAVRTLSKKRSDYGNARCLPVISGDLLISTFGYSDSVHAFSRSTGRGEWMVRLDDGLFQNWASPVLSSTGRLFVPRVNGIVHEVDISNRKVVNSISVEIGRYADNRYHFPRRRHFGEDRWEGTQPITHESRFDKVGPYPSEILISGVATTPIVFDDILIVGGVSGRLRAYLL